MVDNAPFPPLFPGSGNLTNPVPEDDKPVDPGGFVREYEDIFIKVKKWGSFEGPDIERNGLRIYDGPVPDFVARFERELDSKPGLAPDAYNTYKGITEVEVLDAYFGPLKRSVEGGSLEEFISESDSDRRVENLEARHLSYIAVCDWEKLWEGEYGCSFVTGPSMDGLFFDCFALTTHETCKTTTVLSSNMSWPISLIVKCENENGPPHIPLGRFQPRSDLLVSKSTLPRLLVEVSSKPREERPEDLVRMLLTGAAIVRFANRFLDAFMVAKNFVLFAIYIGRDGRVTRYLLFQEPNNRKVLYKKSTTTNLLYTSADRAKFVRQLYNLRHVLERDEETEDTKAKIQQIFANDCAELGAHGYEVVERRRDFVDESGFVIAPFIRMPSHILTVYQQSVPSERFIAKKVHEESNELEIFELLNTFQPKSEHIISLHESFQTQSTSWAILPKMTSLARCHLYGKVAQVCWGLIKGVAYLHKFRIAHRDIKPENLVVVWDSCLKIIDFDVAMRVKDEDEVVDGQCGTKGWMAPEMEEKSMYSPIKADRWSTGQILLYLLNKFSKEDTVLRMTARKLTTHNPELRLSMLQVAASLSNVVNVAVERKASRSLQDTVEVDGESAKSPRMKKQKL